jgi:Phage integrase family
LATSGDSNLAVDSLLADLAEERPVICVVDDTQGLDAASAQTLAFVARRLQAESVGLVFAVRDPAGDVHLAGLPELAISGLDDQDANTLLESVLAGPLDERVRDRIVAETRGNPLALLELPRGRSPIELAGGFGLDDEPALAGRIEQTFRDRVTPMPPATQRLLLIAAAEPTGDPLLVWRAAAALGIDAAAAAPATDAGLVDLGAQVRFRHPLVRSAIYGGATPEERQAVHHALADATDAAGQRLSRDAIEHRIAIHAKAATRECPSLQTKQVTPHVLRHTTAMRLLHAGIDIAVIALWLGHESIETTRIYLFADLDLKQKAIAKTRQLGTPSDRYRPPDKLIAWLEAL